MAESKYLKPNLSYRRIIQVKILSYCRCNQSQITKRNCRALLDHVIVGTASKQKAQDATIESCGCRACYENKPGLFFLSNFLFSICRGRIKSATDLGAGDCEPYPSLLAVPVRPVLCRQHTLCLMGNLLGRTLTESNLSTRFCRLRCDSDTGYSG